MTRSPDRLGPAYWRVLVAGGISNAGDGITLVALPLFAATLTRDPARLAIVTVTARLPWLLFALPAGALIDRSDRRRVMVAADAVRMVIMVGLAVVAATDSGSVALLAVVALLLGMAEVAFDNAAQAFLPAIVHRDLLETANGRQYAVETVTNSFVGPPLGGLLWAWARAVPFAVDAVSFGASAAIVATVRSDEPSRPAQVVDRRSIRAEILDGLRWLASHGVLRSLALLLGVLNLAYAGFESTSVLFAQEVLGLGSAGYGIALALAAVGSVIGGLIAPVAVGRLGAGRALHASIGLMLVGPLFAGATSQAWAWALLLALTGLASVVWNVITVSMRQAAIPDHLLARVNSAYRFLGWGSMPIGAFLGGVLARWLGLRAPYFVAAAVVGVAWAASAHALRPSAVDAARTGAQA